MADWQPIETAPKDGTNFLAIGGIYHGLPFVARWEPSFYSDQPWKLPLSASRVYEHCLTHWMPLPEPPEAAHG